MLQDNSLASSCASWPFSSALRHLPNTSDTPLLRTMATLLTDMVDTLDMAGATLDTPRGGDRTREERDLRDLPDPDLSDLLDSLETS
ncbi:hypothetical protein PENTCL1PPCAC_10795, partial [Pristionchus entomophagus]